MTALVAVAHGSRDPRSAATVTALVDRVRRQSPGLDVRECFLELSAPRLPDVLDAVRTDGHDSAVVVPLLLGNAYHAGTDIPGAVRTVTARWPRFSVATAPVLGPDPRLETVALERLRSAGMRAGDGVVLAGAGSSHEAANDAVRAVASRFDVDGPAVAAFASAGSPRAAEAATALHERGAGRIALAPWFLAPGRLLDRVIDEIRDRDPDAPVAEPLGAHPLVADVVLSRYAEALEPTARTLRYA